MPGQESAEGGFGAAVEGETLAAADHLDRVARGRDDRFELGDGRDVFEWAEHRDVGHVPSGRRVRSQFREVSLGVVLAGEVGQFRGEHVAVGGVVAALQVRTEVLVRARGVGQEVGPGHTGALGQAEGHVEGVAVVAGADPRCGVPEAAG
ncbi:hypothetical protein ABZT48_42450 [Streptomyces avermitilis]|uniref:hypothetical protein n=1 Tax=Streptomyces avermitilis TaxID=33903 RepID=UPI0033B573D9